MTRTLLLLAPSGVGGVDSGFESPRVRRWIDGSSYLIRRWSSNSDIGDSGPEMSKTVVVVVVDAQQAAKKEQR